MKQDYEYESKEEWEEDLRIENMDEEEKANESIVHYIKEEK